MKAYLIDAENVNFDSFIKQKTFKKNDYFYIIGNASLKFSFFTLRFLQDKKVKFYDFNECSKDYADKIILSLLGFLLAKKKIKKCFIVSNDKIFSRLDFTKELYKKRVKVLAPNNEKIKKIEKSDYHIELFEKNQDLIMKFKEKSKNLSDFHCLLQKHFKIHGTLIYKYLRESQNELYFTNNKKIKTLAALKPPAQELLQLEQISDTKSSQDQTLKIEEKALQKLDLRSKNKSKNIKNSKELILIKEENKEGQNLFISFSQKLKNIFT